MNHGDEDNSKVDVFFKILKKQMESAGYHLNPDIEFTRSLLKSILVNKDRYGYEACPCRLASGVKEEDLDIICPCDYRDTDLDEYDTCYCGLYVSDDILKGKEELKSIPDRRPAPEERDIIKKNSMRENIHLKDSLPLPVWRCRVCGYLCAREEPPLTCPICKVDKDRFERFM